MPVDTLHPSIPSLSYWISRTGSNISPLRWGTAMALALEMGGLCNGHVDNCTDADATMGWGSASSSRDTYETLPTYRYLHILS